MKSSLNRPKVEHAVEKAVKLGWSTANWQTFRARRSFGVIRFRTLHVSKCRTSAAVPR